WIKWQDGNNTVLPNLANTKLMTSSTNYYQQAAFGIAAETLNYTIDGEYQFEFDSAFDSINLFNGMYGKTSTELATARNSGNPAGATMGKIAYDYDMTYVRNGDKLTLSSVTGTDMYSNGKYSGLPGGSNGSASGKDNLQYLSYVHYKQKTDTFAATPTNNFFPMDNVYFLDRMLNSTSVKGRTDADGLYILSSFGKLQTDTGVIATERRTGQTGGDSSGNYGTFYVTSGTPSEPYSMVSNDDHFAHNSFFGMHDELKFTIPEDYCGPLEFFFYGDDDMWVYLDGQLICDIGGVHSSIAEYVNLWDYIDTGSAYSTLARATGSEEHTLSIFYTERGAYGSTCYVSFTLPVASTAPRAIGVSKEAVRINNAVVEDVYEDDFTFNVSFYKADDTENPVNTSVELTYHKTLVNGDVQEVSVTEVPFNVNLKSGESFIMQNLPEDYAFFSVEETGASGSRIKGSDGNYFEPGENDNHIHYYTTDIEATGGLVDTDARTATLVPIDAYNIATARFTNIPAVSEMPETGGGGIMWFMLIGFALTVIPMGAGIFSTVKKAKRFLAK
ncbi:MAG: fibro-slime domain-containing protein, partial [Clostridia bacterium]|nr:fibro-slime domain-containing protein [Clostridia bacterium]